MFKKFTSFMLALIMTLSTVVFDNSTTVLGATLGVGDKVTVETDSSFVNYGNYYDSPIGSAMDYIVDENGKKQYAYCIDHHLQGVADLGAYDVTLQTYDNLVVEGMLANGFPNKSFSGLTDKQAYYATKMAIITYLTSGWEIDGWSAGVGGNDAMIVAMKEITKAGESYTRPTNTGAYSIEKISTDINGNDETHTYKVTSSTGGTVSINIEGDFPSGTKINGSATTTATVNVNENFTISFTKPEGDYTKSFNLKVDGEATTQSVVLGVPDNSNVQRYAITMETESNPVETTVTYTNTEPTIPIPDPTPTNGDLVIYKYENGTRIPLEGAKFEFRGLNNEISNIYTTNSNGTIAINDIPDGNYVLKEVQAPKNYVIDYDFPLNVKIDSTSYPNGQEITIHNKKIPKMEVMKIDGETGLPLAGAVLEIAYNDGAEKTTVTTGANGKAEFQPPYIGMYTVTEINPPSGYILEELPQNVYINGIDDVVVTFKNYTEPKIRITKHDYATGELLPNAEFSITNKSTGEVIYEGITDSNGEISLDGLDEGVYVITEIAPPNNYIKVTDSRELIVNSGKSYTVKFDNKLKPSLEITKIDGETGEPLANTTFKVEMIDSSFVSEYTTDSNGKILLEYIDEGAYKVTEILAPSGYVINELPKTIDVKWNGNNDFIHTLIFENYTKPSLIVEKYDEATNELLPNAQFRIEGVDNNLLWEGVLSAGDITAGATQEVSGSLEDGRIVINGLDEGTYKITEINPPSGYTFSDTTENPRTVVIEKNKTTTVKIDNRPLPDLLIKKLDAITGLPVEGVIFEISKADGEFTTQKQTDENGIIEIEDMVEGTYTITEISAPPQYIVDTNNSRIVQIKWNGGDKGDGEYELIFENTLKPTLVINKLSGLGGFGLAGARFKVEYRQADGGLKTIGTYTTNANGQIVLPYVDTGWYVITEVKAPNGYQLPSNPTKEIYLSAGENSYSEIDTPDNANTGDITVDNGDMNNSFKVTYGADIEEIAKLFTTSDSVVYNSSLDFDNYPLNSIVIKKVDALTGELLNGATFELIKVAEGVSGSQGTTIGTYTTDYTGVIVITGLTSGHYIVRETKAPINYDMNVNNQQQAYLAEDGTSIVELMFSNYPYGRLVINKMDTDTKEPLQGATFEVTNSKGEYVGTAGNGHYTTDIEGVITIDNLPPDSYVVTEIKAPTNYAIDQENNVKVVEIGYGETKEVDFYNKAFSTLVIRKLDTDTKEMLAGAEFKITNSDGTVVGNSNGIFTTDQDGLITISDLPVGSYIVSETKAPNNYILADSSQTVDVRGNTTHTLAFYNTKKSSAQIVKIDGETKEPLKGAEFKVYKANGELVGTYTTDGDGLIILPHLDNGWFKAVETKAPTGFVLDDTPQDFEIIGNQFVKLTFENFKKSTLVIRKMDTDTREPLKGATFEVKKQNGENVGSYTTDVNGLITISNLEPNTYVVTETKSPTGYVLEDNSQTAIVKADKTVTLDFYNSKMTSLIIKKIAESDGSPLAGAEFKVTTQEGTLIGNYTTDVNGLINIPTLKPNWYVVSETKAPSGYLLDETPKIVEVKTDVPTEVVFANKLKSGFQIIKIDSITGEPLSGAKFTVYKKTGDVVGTYTTDENGVIIVDGLDNGWYKLAETTAPNGYQIDETPKDVELTGDQFLKITFANTPMGGLKIIKTNSKTGEPIAGVEFEISHMSGEKVLNESNGTKFVTDSTGQIYLPNLKDGTYTVTETKEAEGYFIDASPKNVIVTAGKPTILEVPNTPMGGLRIVKTNAKTGARITGVEFEITKENGEKVLNQTNGTKFITDSNGEIYLPNLENGNYIVTETKEADGYFIDNTPKNATVTSDIVSVLEVKNTPSSGLVIIKTDEKTGKPLQGVEFDILRADGSRVTANILDNNQLGTENNSPNKNINGNGAVNGSYVTDNNGRIYLNHLAVGEYHIVETKALDGYELDQTIHSVTVREGIQEALKVTNRQKAGLRIKKIDSVTKLPIYNVEFRIYNFETKKEVAGPFYTDNNGMIDFSGILEAGRYTIIETRPADNYIRDDMPKTIEFKEGTYTEIVWENTPLMGQIQITKKSANDNETNMLPKGTVLADAVFEVRDYRTGTVVDQFKTGTNGVGVSKALPLGRYVLKEVQAPKYYKISEEELDITIEHSGQILKYEFTNESANLGVAIRKTGVYETMAGLELDYKLTTVQNQSSVPLNDFFVRDILPTDAMRVNKIVTGTYNQSLRYKVMYKTNLNDYRVMADSLQTTTNNVINCSPSALGLYSNEYVTEIMFVFGTVKAGFSSIEIPRIIGTTNQGLVNGLEFANKADIGGTYGGEWIISNSTWVTKVYNPNTSTNMPRTGY